MYPDVRAARSRYLWLSTASVRHGNEPCWAINVICADRAQRLHVVLSWAHSLLAAGVSCVTPHEASQSQWVEKLRHRILGLSPPRCCFRGRSIVAPCNIVRECLARSVVGNGAIIPIATLDVGLVESDLRSIKTARGKPVHDEGLVDCTCWLVHDVVCQVKFAVIKYITVKVMWGSVMFEENVTGVIRRELDLNLRQEINTSSQAGGVCNGLAG